MILSIAGQLDKRDYAWVFVGPGWESYAKNLTGLGWTVIYPDGFLPAPRHYEYFGEGDIYLMLSKLEGGPLTLLETMGLGMWPICTHTGLAPDIIRHGINGYIVQAYDGSNAERIVAQIADHIHKLDGVALKSSQKIIQDSVARYTWDNFQKEVHLILQSCF